MHRLSLSTNFSQNVLARNFKRIEKTTLYLAFFINVILLFHRVNITHPSAAPLAQTNGLPGAVGSIEAAAEDMMGETEDDDDVVETIYITGMTVPYLEREFDGWFLAQILYGLSVVHAFASFALLVSFYQLKIPLITFKRYSWRVCVCASEHLSGDFLDRCFSVLDGRIYGN